MLNERINLPTCIEQRCNIIRILVIFLSPLIIPKMKHKRLRFPDNRLKKTQSRLFTSGCYDVCRNESKDTLEDVDLLPCL